LKIEIIIPEDQILPLGYGYEFFLFSHQAEKEKQVSTVKKKPVEMVGE